jgi:hypothetical protein
MAGCAAVTPSFLAVAPPTDQSWLVYATPLIAAVALVVSVLSLLVSYAAYRDKRPRISVAVSGRAGGPYEETLGNAHITLTVRNQTGGSIEVEKICIDLPARWHLVDQTMHSKYADGPQLPCELGERRARTWEWDLGSQIYARKGYAHLRGEPKRFSPAVLLAELRGCQILVRLGDGSVYRQHIRGLSPTVLNKLYMDHNRRSGLWQPARVHAKG